MWPRDHDVIQGRSGAYPATTMAEFMKVKVRACSHFFTSCLHGACWHAA